MPIIYYLICIMCYDAASLTKHKKVYTKRFGIEETSVEDVQQIISPLFHANGFTHPLIPVITNEQPEILQAFEWGLIPHWTKDPTTAGKISNQTLNARIETIEKKPSFRNSAGKKHCLVVVDGYYEYHHFKGKAYPFYIQRKDEQPFALAGIWEKWIYDKEQITKNSFSIVTAAANPLMAKIHNNPKADGPRMPLVLSPENEQNWLRVPDLNEAQDFSSFCTDTIDLPLKAYPVTKLRGKAYPGNQPEVMKAVDYPELADFMDNL